MSAKLKEQFAKEVIPTLKKEYGYDNQMAVPRIEKVTLNVGLNQSKMDQKMQEVVEETMRRITGQQPIKTKARQSIAGFKIREGMVVGMKVTLRGPKMWDFLYKLVNVTFARVTDFRGIKDSAVDENGNFSYGFKEHIAFPEINPDEIESLHGLEVNITTSAPNHEQGLTLFKALGFPFKKDEQK